MAKKWFKLALIALLVLILAACGGAETPTQAPEADDVMEEPAPPEVEEEAPPEEIDAAALFSSNCSRCHGTDRSGRNGPALLPERLTKDPSTYEATITNGSGPMPSFGSKLSADEISALVDFILSEPE